MALSKEYSVDYEIKTEYRHIQIREKTSIMENGKELSASYHRRVLHPDADISNESDEIKGLADTLWTDAVKKAWDDKLKADAGS
tara:strand:- start:176 stop:427 length:252 start_codon:yes stop_codon:yes gene_type:complete